MNSATVTSLDSDSPAAPQPTRRPVPLQNQKSNGTTSETPADVTKATTDELRKALQKKYRHVVAVHCQLRPSTLSHDSTAAPSFLGFRNLMVIVLVVGNLRLMIENLQKYGVLICLHCHDFRRSDILLGLGLYFLIPCHLFAAYLIELVAAHQARGSRVKTKDGSASPTHDQSARFKSTWKIVAWAHALNITLALAVTTLVVYFNIYHPLIGTLTELHAVIVWLKTSSYAFTNRDLRHAYLHPVKGELDAMPEIYQKCPYPENITMSNLVYFWWAPTLVYQPAYPRTDKIRWIFVAKRLGEVFCLSVFIWFASAQYAAPVLLNSLDKIASLDITNIMERLMKLSTISLVIWLAGFFALFQSFLNALAEVMRFGDRSFYDDWWNSPSLGTYWRTWNKPVSQYFRRHVYSPMVGRGWSPFVASVAVFFLSAVLHEVLVGVPTHNIIGLGVAFLGMLLQLPLIAITTPLEKMKTPTGRMIGNCIFWISFTILGQPFAALMYFYAWQAKYGSVSRQMARTTPGTL
ncbi:diacylglycerol O-acyltransferase [Verticillium dahliae VdLs.17]|uniref:O-acyltransferase n=1 Tax=Verticillium dahliae (strain VdLs.17 / ATCC MYA-4575 / FGSC 10137) TaxID=498257 RepID=G2X7I6_VERDV|nr:diacylglycerol O-acyltransferase [Verticillium dahliae VdLs.17]EGY14954.1 diacylglycerol O-acyltransferase [Verticillium dahliae VdLs.17]KAH6694591.1 diacylglycerol O-acyltransferase [Verticillium dahliae]